MLSRENPSTVWVRSLVPKLKKSACLAILSAIRQARGKLDHRPDRVVDRFRAELADRLVGGLVDQPPHRFELPLVVHERDHDLDAGSAAGLVAHRHRGADDGPHLHLVDLREHDPEAASTGAEHGVGLLEVSQTLEVAPEPLQRGAAPPPALQPIDLDHELLLLRQELVERRIEQPDRDRQALHRTKDPLEVTPLERQQLVERPATRTLVTGEDHARASSGGDRPP